jgi:hypothetical protein
VAVVCLLAAAGCVDDAPEAEATPVRATSAGRGGDPAGRGAGADPPAPPFFVERTAEVGVDFRHEPGAAGAYRPEEIMGPGCALLDADGDGRLDLYLVNGDRDGAGARDALYRATASGRYEDVADAAGLRPRGYGQGCVPADYDGDGDVDLYLTNVGADALWRNEGDGTFTDATAAAGLDNAVWSVSAAFLDYDADGRLDLYVANYLDAPHARRCFDAAGVLDYCGPQNFDGLSDRLYRNEGAGRFRDVTAASGIGGAAAPGLGVIADDFSGDGRVDIYVANDQAPNLLWINRGDGTFVDRAAALGGAYNRDGAAEAGMGLALGDVDGDGRDDVFVTHFGGETSTLYRGGAGGGFVDGSWASGLGPATLRFTSFGTGFVDADHDGDLDVLACNGAINRRPRTWPGASPASPFRAYAEPNQVFENDGTGVFAERADGPAGFTAPVEVSRGLALGDLDGDGDLDVLVTNVGGPARVYRNDAPRRGRWIRIRPLAAAGGRAAIGARVAVTAGGVTRARTILAGSSYASAHEPVAHFGLGPVDGPATVTVRWGDGRERTFADLALDAEHVLRRDEAVARGAEP